MKVVSRSDDQWTEADDDLSHPRIKQIMARAARSQRLEGITAVSFKERVLDWEPRGSEQSRPVRAQEDLHTQLSAALRQLPAVTRHELVFVLQELSIEAAAELWGDEPELRDVVSATIWHQLEATKRTQEAVGRSLSLPEAAARAAIAEEDLLRLAEMRAISTVRTKSDVRMPDWQFDDAGGLIQGLEPLLRAFPGSAGTLSAWVNREHPDLGETPRSALLRGRTDAVVYAASRGSGIA